MCHSSRGLVVGSMCLSSRWLVAGSYVTFWKGFVGTQLCAFQVGVGSR
jgi:hypothetical protein